MEILVQIYLNLTKNMKFSLKNITIFIAWNFLTINVLATHVLTKHLLMGKFLFYTNRDISLYLFTFCSK